MMTNIQTITLASAASSITFSSIPQTGKDLYLTLCYDGTSNASFELDLQINATTNVMRSFQGYTTASNSSTNDQISVMDSESPVTNMFHTITVYIPNYTLASARMFSATAIVVGNSNVGFSSRQQVSNGISSSSAAVSSISFVSGYLDFLAGSTASLYVVS